VARSRSWHWLLGAWALGLALVHRPMLTSGFALQHGDPGDARFVVYTLEHAWRWMLGRAPNTSFWDAPFFFPAKNVNAYSDVMVGVGPFYWIWRALGFEIDTSAQLWVLTSTTLDLVAAYFFLLRVFRFRPLASAAGAFVFAFALARSNLLNHPQLVGQFWSIWALHALAGALVPRAEWPRRRRRLAIAAFFACVVLQLWAGFYLGWYLGLGLGIALLWSLVFAESRRVLVALARAEPATIIASAFGAVVLLLPMALHYLHATQDVGVRAYEHVAPMVPRPQTWFHMGDHSWIYGWTAQKDLFARIPVTGEHRVGVGLLTTAGWIAGLVLGRTRPALRIAACTAATVMLVATTTSSESLSLWRAVHAFVPGGNAIRAVARIGLLMLVPISIGVAAAIDAIAERKNTIAAGALGLACIFEQGTDAPMFDKRTLRAEVRGLAARVPADCEVVLFSPKDASTPSYQHQIDSMYAALAAGIPTVNGYSGNAPRGWDLEQTAIREEEDRARVQAKLDAWVRASGLASRVCHVVP
jgi:hypothetical protein